MGSIFTDFDRFLWGCKNFVVIDAIDLLSRDVIVQKLKDVEVVDIEAVILGKGVRVIGSNTFKNWNSLKRVWLSPDVIEIGASAFYGCSRLEFISCDGSLQTKLPREIITIGDRAFYGTGLSNIAYLHVNELGTSVFENSAITQLDKITGTDTIPEKTFKGCKNLCSPLVIKDNIVRCYDFMLEDSSVENIIFDNQPSLFISSRALGNSKVKQVTFRTHGEIIWELPLLTAQTLCVSVFPNSPAHEWAIDKHVTNIDFIDR